MGIAGFIIAVIGLVLSPIPIINNFAAIMLVISLVLCAIGWRGARKRGGKKGLSVAGVIISVVGLIIVFGSQAFYVDALDDAGESIDKEFSDIDGSNTDKILKNDVTIKIGKFETKEDEFGLVETSVEVTFTNKTKTKQSFDAQIEAVDSDGTRIGDIEYASAENLGAGQSAKTTAFTYVEDSNLDAMKSAKFSVVEVTKY